MVEAPGRVPRSTAARPLPSGSGSRGSEGREDAIYSTRAVENSAQRVTSGQLVLPRITRSAETPSFCPPVDNSAGRLAWLSCAHFEQPSRVDVVCHRDVDALNVPAAHGVP